jgi:hypothetical protein
MLAFSNPSSRDRFVPGFGGARDGHVFGSVRGSTNFQEEKTMATAVAKTPTGANNGFVSKPRNHSVDHTVEKLTNILKSKGVTLFALVDHSGEAGKVGMNMNPTKLLIFGSPKAGTPRLLPVSPLTPL